MVLFKRILIGLGVLAPLTFSSLAYAATVPSDFAQDVKDGTAQLQSDPAAHTQANNVSDNENVEGQVDDGQVEVDETVGDQESNMDNSQSSESHDSSDKVNTGGSDHSGSTTQTTDNGGSNQ